MICCIASAKKFAAVLHSTTNLVVATSATTHRRYSTQIAQKQKVLGPKNGQYMVKNAKVAETISRCFGINDKMTVLESNPGAGILSRAMLLAGAKRIVAVGSLEQGDTVAEDTAAIAEFQQNKGNDSDKFVFHNGDIRRLDLLGGCPPTHVLLKERVSTPWEENCNTLCFVALLPSPRAASIVTSWVFKMATRYGPFQWGRIDSFFLLPRDFAMKMLAEDPKKKSYCRLSVLLHSQAEVQHLLEVPKGIVDYKGRAKEVFDLVRVRPFVTSTVQDIDYLDYSARRMFLQSKQLSETIGTLAPGMSHTLATLDIDPNTNTRQLTVENHIALANALQESKYRPVL